MREAGTGPQRLAGRRGDARSLARLEARIAQAEAAGTTDVAKALRARLKARHDLEQLLPGRIEQLKKAQVGICIDLAAAMKAAR